MAALGRYRRVVAAGAAALALQRALGRAWHRVALVPGLAPAVVRANLAVCFPERDAPGAKRRCGELCGPWGIGLFEFGRAWWGSIEPMRRSARFIGVEHCSRRWPVAAA